MSRRVVITGLGVISAIGHNVPDFWNSLLAGKSGIGPITNIDTTNVKVTQGAEVKGYDPNQYFEKKDLDMLDRFSQFCLIAAREAVADAGITFTDAQKENAAVLTGTSMGGETQHEKTLYDLFHEGKTRAHPFTIPLVMPNAGASQVSMHFGLMGPAYTISSACASSNHAIGNAFWLIKNGQSDVALAGGSETPFTWGYLKSWEAIRVVAPDTCRPFSKNRQGMILGEGGAMILLESLESAQARGAKIYAEIVGFGMTSDASHITKPSQIGAEKAIRLALKEGGLDPSEIDYINAHGTATVVNDAMEVAAIKNVLGEHAKHVSISSTKSMHGHVLGGTSALEAVATSLAVFHDVCPPTANYMEPDPECEIDVVPNEAKPKTIRAALSNSFAFGGLNAVLAFKKYSQ
ncbi:MAG: beta-ketoacyl-[acyl-carrier-protein] synthase family protein [Sphingobacteriales bacterium]